MHPIECRNVWKKYTKGEKITALRDAIPQFAKNFFKSATTEKLKEKEFWVLKDVTFEVKKGEVLGIIGPNGAGKSTILKLLSKIIKPTKGTFDITGRLSALIEITAGFHPDFTGRENIYFNGAILGMNKKEIERKFDQIVDFSGVSEFIDTPVKRYSSGMYARLGFAVAAHVDPEVLLVDEVLAVGDMTFQAKCAQKMRDLLKSGTTIILVAHNIPLVQSICNRVILLNHGEVLKEGTPEEVIPHYESLVFEKSEEELRKKIASEHSHIYLESGSQLEITDVFLNAKDQKSDKNFKCDEILDVKLNYSSHIAVEHPIFTINVVRADGVICCSTNSREASFAHNIVPGKGTINVHLGHLRLTPGVYHLSIGIWDHDMIHSYAVRKKDFFRIFSDKLLLTPEAVFLPQVHWQA
jgi:ABC-type polysaccharide/polyol phosphate transport system ATPase subunit